MNMHGRKEKLGGFFLCPLSGIKHGIDYSPITYYLHSLPNLMPMQSQSTLCIIIWKFFNTPSRNVIEQDNVIRG